MAVQLVQNTFQFGEISPLMLARTDSQIYFRGARRLRNVLVIPQGGVTKRFGTDQVASILSTITDYTLVKIFIFDYEDGEHYILLFRDLAIDVYHNDLLVATVVSTYMGAEISDLSLDQSQNLVFITHSAHIPGILRRTSAHAGWALDAAPRFVNNPTYDFQDDYEGFDFQIKVGGVVIVTAQNLLGQVVTVHASSATFNANHSGGLFFAESGTIRLTTYTSTTQMSGRIIKVFDDDSALFHSTNIISGQDCIVTEVVFSAIRGYPQKVGFFQNRLFFGKTTSLPGGLWGSNYNGFKLDAVNFDDSDAFDTNAVSTTLQSKKAVIIKAILGYKTIVVLTSSGLFSSTSLDESAITPRTVQFLNQQTADGASDVDGLVFDNSLIFFDKGGKKVRDLVIKDSLGHYESRNISVLASHLIDSPYSAAVFENSSEEDGSWLMVVNSGTDSTEDGQALEGTLAIYQSVPEQEITAWTLSFTDGKFRQVSSDEVNVYFVVERVVNVFEDADTILVKAVNQTAALASGGAGAIAIFVANADTMTIADASQFTEIQFAFGTLGSSTINPLFEYSTGVATWATFTPTDLTVGMTVDSVVKWDLTDIPLWVVGTGAEFLVRITRQAVTVVTPPIADTVQVVIPAQTRLFIEKVNFNRDTDSCVYTTLGAPGTNVTGLDHLEGLSVKVIGDTAIMADQVVANGEITVEYDVTDVEVGLNYVPEVVPMPIVTPMQVGQNVYLPKTVKSIFLDYNTTLALTLNGTLLRPFQSDVDLMDTPPIPKTGYSEFQPMSGWLPRAEIIISQAAPLPFTLIGIGMQVTLEDDE